MSFKSLHNPLLTLAAFAAMAFALSACSTGEDLVADSAPPANQFEVAPQLDDPQGEIWIPGYWALSGNDFVWVAGKVVSRPDPTAMWKTARWVRHTYGWTFEQGHWE